MSNDTTRRVTLNNGKVTPAPFSSAHPLSGGYVHGGWSSILPNTTIVPSQPIPTLTPNTTLTATGPVPNATPVPTLGEAFKAKKAGKKNSHIVFVLDDSGSMQSCRDATIAGFNEYLFAQKTEAKKGEQQIFVSLFKFDGNNVRQVYFKKAIGEVAVLTRADYNPQGGTNLYDAIGGVMMTINSAFQAVKKCDRESVVITILTDGEENMSRTFKNTDVKAMVEKAEAKNWAFLFLGANIDAFAVGNTMGFGVQNTMQYSTSNMESTIAAASNMTTRLRSSYSKGMDTTMAYGASAFTAQERSLALKGEDE